MVFYRQMTMYKLFVCLLSCLLFIPAQAGELSYAGSSTVSRFIEEAAAVYKDSTFVIDTESESSGGEICTYRGNCDIGGLSRPVNERYVDKGVVAHLIGYDAIAVIVNNNNYIKELTSCQLSGIFSGKIRNWLEIGGSDRAIDVFTVKETSGTYKVFREAVLHHEDYDKVKKIGPDRKILSKVAGSEGAIGHISVALIEDNRI